MRAVTTPNPMTTTPDLAGERSAIDFGRGMTRRWRMRTRSASGRTLADRVLDARGLAENDAAFLDPKLTQLHEPSLIPHLDRAAARILEAVRGGERVTIFGDYDVDGITATVILVRTLRVIGPDADITHRIPHRIDDGYGISPEAVDELADEGSNVIVTVDCGITAHAAAERARARGVHLIITDHHNPPASASEVPDAFAVVHPRHPESSYPFADLCGAGVAYKLAWRLAALAGDGERATEPMRTVLIDLLAPASLGTIADVVPLVGENRVLARFGLRRCRGSSIVGLAALVEASGLAGENIDAEGVGFKLGPRLNACGRMGHAKDAVELLLTDDASRARVIAEQLSAMNTKRQSTERAIAKQAAEMAEAAGMTSPGCRAIVLAHEDWHPGVIGIVCSRLVEKFGRPTLLLQRCEREGICKGSGRSIDGFNLHGALEACRDLLTSFGGHDMAAGLALRASDLGAFTDTFTGFCHETLTDEDLVPKITLDAEASLDDLTLDAARGLEMLAPFGRANPRPTLLFRGVRARALSPLGSRGDHLAMVLEDQRGGPTIRCVGWSWAQRGLEIPPGSLVDVAAACKISTFRGATTVELELRDMRLASDRCRD